MFLGPPEWNGARRCLKTPLIEKLIVDNKEQSTEHLVFLGEAVLLGLLWQQDGVDVWQDTTLGNRDTAQQLVQFLIVSDGELQVTWDDTRLLVVTGGVSSQLENFSSQVFQDGSQVHGGTGTNTLGIASFAELAVDTTDRELQTGLSRASLGRFGSSSVLSSSHGECKVEIDDGGPMRLLYGRTATHADCRWTP